MSLRALTKSCTNLILDKKQQFANQEIPNADINFWKNEPVFCPYQINIINDQSPVIIWEKGRQLGASYCLAFLAVVKAISNKKGTVVSSYNRDAVKNFITDCSKWARLFNKIFTVTTYSEVINEKEINILELKFLNGRRIIGLAGDSVQFRSYSGSNFDAVVDEASYRRNLPELLASVFGLLIHGGQVTILSTHGGVDNEFNKLIQKVKSGELPYSHHKTTFREAVSQGLYKRIAAKNKTIPTPEEEQIWVDSIYALYGVRASEELDAIPSDYSQEGQLFDKFQYIDSLRNNPYEYIWFRSYDIASTEDDKNDDETAFYTASVKCAYHLESQQLIITDWTADKLAPLEADQKIVDLAVEDGQDCYVILEIEPGSTGEKYIAIMQDRLVKEGIYNVHGYRPYINKIKRCIPVANSVRHGRIVMLEDPHNHELERILRRVSKHKKPLVQDLCDALSNLYDYIKNEFNSLYN
jgi:phage terminase large subunit-like protein